MRTQIAHRHSRVFASGEAAPATWKATLPAPEVCGHCA